jgi:thiol-disulfide isomerase/thioredoxin
MCANKNILLLVCMLMSITGALAQGTHDEALVQAAPAATKIQWRDVTLINGQTITAQSLNSQTVIVQFWASWCPFCARQNPNIEALHRNAKGRYRVLTFSIDHTEKAARDYLKTKGYSFDVAMSPVRGNDMFKQRRGLPEVLVVKPGGVVAERIPGEMFAEDVQELAIKYGRTP